MLEADIAKGDLSPVLVLLLSFFAAYLVGSIPTGYLVGKYRGLDLRREGSGNIGATNALRVLGKKAGSIVLAGDALKGWLAVMGGFMLAKLGFDLPEHMVILSGVAAAAGALLGHSFPVWLGFQGGKGISTSAGIMIALFPPLVFISGLLFWIILFYTTRYVSIASLGAAFMLPTSAFVLMAFGECDLVRAIIAAIMCGLAVWRHKPNISRLMAGTEKRFERKKLNPTK